MHAATKEAELLEKITRVVEAAGGKVSSRDAHAISGTLTAIKAKWFLGGRQVTDRVTCRLVPDAHEVHLQENAVETSWGFPPPTLTVETSSQYGSRVSQSRTDRAIGGGGRLEFGRFREDVEKVVSESGWKFVFEVG
jgi:hypothetical protein